MQLYVLLILCITITIEIRSENSCIPRSYGPNRIVCVCNSSYCDTVDPVQQLPPFQYTSYTTNIAGLRFHKTTKSFNTNKTQEHSLNATVININPGKTYQKIIGFGGAITDSTGINFYSLDVNAREHILKSYFSNEGIECNIARIPMGGSDFSTHAYSYNDGEPDPNLLNFHLEKEDLEYKIPLAKFANQLTNNNLYLFTSTWTAPKWMKTNGLYNGIGFIKKEMLQPWANYFLKFLEEYHKHGIDFWGITTGNEPSAVLYSNISTVGWVTDLQSLWIEQNLGPTLRTSLIRSIRNIKILLFDDITALLPWFVNKVLENFRANIFINGIATHWYADGFISYDVLTATHYIHPTKFILSTEASIANVTLGSWLNAERYAIDIILNLQNWVTGWTEWNIALNLNGGPSYITSSLDASFIVNATGNEFYKQPTYYSFGHFAKFLPRGSTRINSTVSNFFVRSVAFKRPDAGTTVIVINLLDSEIPLMIHDIRRGTIYDVLSPKSITTFLYW